MRTCECAEGTGLHGCPARARWLVKAGKVEQAACSRHLARVAGALSWAQGERLVLTLIPLG